MAALWILLAFVAGVAAAMLAFSKTASEQAEELANHQNALSESRREVISLSAQLAEAVLDAGRHYSRASMATARAEAAESVEPALRESLKRLQTERDTALSSVAYVRDMLAQAIESDLRRDIERAKDDRDNALARLSEALQEAKAGV